MKKLEGKVAVITGATSGMALASAKLFVAEGAYAFITGRSQKRLEEAVTIAGHDQSARHPIVISSVCRSQHEGTCYVGHHHR